MEGLKYRCSASTRWILAISTLYCVGIASCASEDNGPFLDELVIEAFIYRDLPVDAIRVKGLTPRGGADSLNTAINDALVTITDDFDEYTLVPSPGDSGYYHFDGQELKVEEGRSYNLRVAARGKTVEAETIVPGKPSSVALNVTQVEVPEINSALDLLDLDVPQVVASWDNPSATYHFVTVENIEEDPETILPEDVPLPNFRLITTPTRSDNFILRIGQVTQYGLYRIRVFKVNQEYADLYETIEQDSRNLTEPISNIENGLGIFTAFNYEDVFLEIVKK